MSFDSSFVRNNSVAAPRAAIQSAAHRRRRWALAAALAVTLVGLPETASACACGCGVFSVATSSMLPRGPGGMTYLEYDYQNQSHNWSGSSSSPAADNPDRQLQSDFYTAGLEYFFNRSWGVQCDVPFDHREFRTIGGPSGNDLVSLNWNGLGDIRLKGIYTGFSPDMSAGLSFGIKLPTGNYTYNDAYDDVDRDSEFGTGSTDLLLGGFFRHQFAADPQWKWFGQVEWDQPVLTRDQYRPGAEVDTAAGLYYAGWTSGTARLTPVAQVIGSYRTSDSGANAADPVASGYRRIMLSPGVELHVRKVSLYADVEWPVYQYFTGDQLAAPVLYKLIVSRVF